VGKTEWALRWAEERGAEIVSCDSLLFYRGMDIGTAKPTREERARVPHHLIDIRDLTEPMDVTHYATLARAAVEAIAARGRPVLVVGGSGFYLKSFFAPVADDVAVPPELRAGIAGRLAAEGLPALVAELRRLNPDGLGFLDPANPRRVTRALERCLASGETLSRLAGAFAARPAPFADWRVEVTEITRPAGELDRRIAARTAGMLRAGLVEEVRGLLAAGLRQNPSAVRAIGYREVVDLIDGRLRPDALEAEIVKNTRALAKKQRTWFNAFSRSLPADRYFKSI
jgi:tRNA dimethylallyltransferase